MKLLVIGLGYVGKALATFLSKNYDVTGVDINPEIVKKCEFCAKNTADFKDFDVFFICLPTSYNDDLEGLETKEIENTITNILKDNNKVIIYIKSTLPIGFTRKLSEKLNTNNICYSPEFLREKTALEDLASPSRIVIGGINEEAIKLYLSMFPNNIPTITCSSDEAEAIKLFSNTYLANRIAFFNEVDTFAELNDLDTQKIIKGICLDPRIGDYYNKPSYGYGGYCLPKDSKQLEKNFNNVPQAIIGASISSNKLRINHIVNQIIKKLDKKQSPLVGIYRLAYRNSPLDDIILELSNKEIGIIIYEPSITDKFYQTAYVVNDLESFKSSCDLILSEAYDDNLSDKVNILYLK